ncbi:MAG: class I SAM-dependent methyltransferase [Myxococcota bacterium]
MGWDRVVSGWVDRVLGGFAVDEDPGGRAFDRAHGVETSWFDLGNYEPTPPSVVEAALDAVPGDPSSATFVDLGSGKGRVVLLASRRPYRKVVGVERSARLHRVAARNLAAFGPTLAPVELVCADAEVAPLPGGPLVVWLFNPFEPAVLMRVLDRLRGRDVHLVYVVPTYLAVTGAAGYHTLARGGEEPWPWRVLGRPQPSAPHRP